MQGIHLSHALLCILECRSDMLLLGAAFYNAFFTALPVGAFAIFDRPVRLLSTLQQNPQVHLRLFSPICLKQCILHCIARGPFAIFDRPAFCLPSALTTEGVVP